MMAFYPRKVVNNIITRSFLLKFKLSSEVERKAVYTLERVISSSSKIIMWDLKPDVDLAFKTKLL